MNVKHQCIWIDWRPNRERQSPIEILPDAATPPVKREPLTFWIAWKTFWGELFLMPRKKASIEHIRYIPHTGQVCCYHCGDAYQATPASMSMIIAIMKQYMKDHRRCKETDRGKRLYEENVQAFEKLPDDRKDHFATLSFPEPQNLGEKITQHLMMEEMAKADLGPDLKIEVRPK